MMQITKEFRFEAAHKLLDYDGPCMNLHGHSYRLLISVQGQIDTNGFVLDFGELKKVVQENIISKLDHQYLNQIIEQPTAENISIWIWQQLLNAKLPICEVKLWETNSSSVTYRGE